MRKFKTLTSLMLVLLLAVSAFIVPTSASTNAKAFIGDEKRVNKISSSGSGESVSLLTDEKSEKTSKNDSATLQEEELKVECVEGEAIVVMKANKKASSLQSAFQIKRTFSYNTDGNNVKNYAVVSDEKLSASELIAQLEKRADVDTAFPNYIYRVNSLTNDSYSGLQWPLQNNGQNGGTSGMDINPEKLWEKSEEIGEECVVAVIDTGINYNHPDLKDVLWKNTYTELAGYGSCGYDFSDYDNDLTPLDDNGHGTNVAGLIAETADNGIGTSGVNKRGVKIMALKVSNEDGGLTFSSIMEAFDYILEAKALGVNIKAVNCSFGGFSSESAKEFYDAEFDELGEAGIITCISAGNSALSIDDSYVATYDDGTESDSLLYLPAATDSEYSIVVAASNENDAPASFTNYGEKVDIAAPGVSMLAAYSSNVFNPSLYDSAQINKTCTYYDNMDSSDFNFYKDNSVNFSKVSGFGDKGYGMCVSAPQASQYYGIMYTTYTLDNTTDDYYVSFDFGQVSNDFTFMIADIPEQFLSSFTVSQLIGYNVFLQFDITADNYWEHFLLPSSYVTVNFTTSTKRALLIIIDCPEDDLSFCLDNIAVSKQGVNEDEFGMYESIQGTSQAAPIVAGAAALVYNSNPSLSALEIIDLIKSNVRPSSKMKGYTETAGVLDLDGVADNIGEYSPEPEIIYGDVNGDNAVNKKDSLLLRMYLADNTVEIDMKAADVYPDGLVNKKDSLYLKQYLAGWDITLGE